MRRWLAQRLRGGPAEEARHDLAVRRGAASVAPASRGTLLAFLADLFKPCAGSQCAADKICDECDSSKCGDGHKVSRTVFCETI